ncbi:unnamed protein product [Vitrella brassicaformis CCMP3155]|uniref:HMG box domain-containing protein n=1 Tax=Vitrella brassicaformis (strain CCMP3155) TaxID=1169540 RepID=A0A0G4FHW9_VITBC|nr:unnamed protein product [Vitrella brassicaformis CCMP3155]|mmetsp:Transcript_47456/g.118552  ORF Transcript_47456/g.118552 Transcript_47456/m.118552 type:complete len:113 (-) Transcript_47456:124-462(-)|eukprot:CEM12683.1 unnamed protein product [Vitrella brassicaformis CCMP3155]
MVKGEKAKGAGKGEEKVKKEEGKKNGKDKKEDKGPKRAVSAWNFYYAERCPQVKEEQPDLENKERMAFIGDEWKNKLSEEEKQPYVDMAAEDKERYEKEKAEWDKENPKEKK